MLSFLQLQKDQAPDIEVSEKTHCHSRICHKTHCSDGLEYYVLNKKITSKGVSKIDYYMADLDDYKHSKMELGLLRGIVNHSYSKSQMDNSERNIEDNRLSDTNRYEVLEKYDEVENEEIGTKSTT